MTNIARCIAPQGSNFSVDDIDIRIYATYTVYIHDIEYITVYIYIYTFVPTMSRIIEQFKNSCSYTTLHYILPLVDSTSHLTHLSRKLLI